MIADVTLTSKPEGRELQVGIRWRSGASRAAHHRAPPKPADAQRTPSPAVELTRRLAADHTNAQIAEQLNAAGLRTGTGEPFDDTAVRWLRWRYQIRLPRAAPGRRRDHRHATRRAPRRLHSVVYAWITTGKLTARRGPDNRLYIPFPPKVEQQCHRWSLNSIHLPAETKIRSAGGAV